MPIERWAARGPRGEAVIIIKTTGDPFPASQRGGIEGPVVDQYRLGSGERLTASEDLRVFVSVDGRIFTKV